MSPSILIIKFQKTELLQEKSLTFPLPRFLLPSFSPVIHQCDSWIWKKVKCLITPASGWVKLDELLLTESRDKMTTKSWTNYSSPMAGLLKSIKQFQVWFLTVVFGEGWHFVVGLRKRYLGSHDSVQFKTKKKWICGIKFFQMVLKKYLYGEHHNLLKTFTRSNNRDCVILGHKITFVPKLQGGGSIKG